MMKSNKYMYTPCAKCKKLVHVHEAWINKNKQYHYKCLPKKENKNE